jgi:Tol biopolymer transport system component
LSNLRTYAPGGPAFYENHGFSPSGKKLIFSSNFARTGSAFLNTDIFTLDLVSGSWTQLTHSGYNEHAHFSPDGARIVWMTNAGISGRGTDYWLMNSDGTDQSRLTYFNSAACPEYLPPTVTAADSSWSPEGDRIVAYIITGLVKQGGKIVMITLDF